MNKLLALLERLHDGEFTLEEFGAAAAAQFVYRDTPQYPETDGGADVVNNVSNATITSAQHLGLMTEEEARAVYDALPDAV